MTTINNLVLNFFSIKLYHVERFANIYHFNSSSQVPYAFQLISLHNLVPQAFYQAVSTHPSKAHLTIPFINSTCAILLAKRLTFSLTIGLATQDSISKIHLVVFSIRVYFCMVVIITSSSIGWFTRYFCVDWP